MKQFGEFELDMLNECLVCSGAQIALPPKPFAVLRYLVEHPGRLITHDELMEALWPETYVQPQVLRTYMLELRKVLRDDAGQPRYIQTLPKRGYRFVASVMELAHPDTQPKSNSAPITVVAVATAAPAEMGTRIVNRDEEMACLKTQFELAAGGHRQVVFVTGEAGIGKTALVDAFCEQTSREQTGRDQSGRDQAIATARGQCVEGFGRKEEYYPVTEALSQLCASREGDNACRVLAKMAPVWLAAIGRECLDPAQPAARERMPGDLCAALEELAAEKPLILVFEDLQWADDSTLHLISALARRRAQARLLIVATCRTQDVAAEPSLKGLKQDLRLRRLCSEIALAPLGKPAVRALLSRELGQEELPAGLAGFVHRRSEGNPLFAIAIVEHLMAQGFLKREEARGEKQGLARWVQTAAVEEMEAGVPDGLAQMIEMELDGLDVRDQRMLEAGSLMNVAFPTWAVAAALEMDPAEAEEACEELARRLYFVEPAGTDELPDGSRSTFYAFAHGLYREVLWRKQTEARRARRHVRIAERLGGLFAGRVGVVAREMAMHYEAASDWQHAVSALRMAAGHALERRAHTEAVELLERALRMVENVRESEREAAALEICAEIAIAGEAMNQAREAVETTSTKA
ncbi:AAA family ATPase [Acidicapsa acidisoli]|uniref:AAA family ATPase n=1 Tax=Acidicapsa acidisoli TaxID=1615681 RepID=UPI0021E03A4B|nr:AAA family ATPase [Acidicapsa acidisoli]